MPAVDPWSAFLRIRDVIESKVGLRADAAVFGSRTQPGALTHRSFRLNMSAFTMGSGERMKPGDNVNFMETVVIHIFHDLVPGQHDTSLHTAFTDTAAIVEALLTSDKTRGCVRFTNQGGSRRIAGHSIETDLTLQVVWSLTLTSAQA